MSYRKLIELQGISSSKEKQKFIKDNSSDENFRRLLYYALNPLITYNLSEKTLRDTSSLDFDEINNYPLKIFSDIFACCEYLSSLRGMDDATVRQVKMYIYQHQDKEKQEVYIKLLSKTLRLGVTAKTVNKVIPDLIPEWEVQQAYPIEKYPVKEGTEFWLTQKLNGVRATFYNGKLISRSGMAYEGLDHIVDEINWCWIAGLVLDGELILKDRDGISDNEAFRIATGIINSDSVDKTKICFRVFDVIPVNDFENSNPIVKYSARRMMMNELCRNEFEYVEVLPVLYHGNDLSKIDALLDKMVREDKEGLMLNTDVPYKRKRHKGILKIKRFYTMDLPIIDCEEGSGRLAGTLGNFVLDYKGNAVRVGSGITDEQRAYFWDNRENIVGSLCEVKYKEISRDKKSGAESLQFPVFIRLRNDKSEVSYG